MARSKQPEDKEPVFDLGAFGGWVISVGGHFNARTVIELSTECRATVRWSARRLGARRDGHSRPRRAPPARRGARGQHARRDGARARPRPRQPYTSATAARWPRARDGLARALVDVMDRLRELALWRTAHARRGVL